jgi:hypothetical protein
MANDSGSGSGSGSGRGSGRANGGGSGSTVAEGSGLWWAWRASKSGTIGRQQTGRQGHGDGGPTSGVEPRIGLHVGA